MTKTANFVAYLFVAELRIWCQQLAINGVRPPARVHCRRHSDVGLMHTNVRFDERFLQPAEFQALATQKHLISAIKSTILVQLPVKSLHLIYDSAKLVDLLRGDMLPTTKLARNNRITRVATAYSTQSHATSPIFFQPKLTWLAAFVQHLSPFSTVKSITPGDLWRTSGSGGKVKCQVLAPLSNTERPIPLPLWPLYLHAQY